MTELRYPWSIIALVHRETLLFDPRIMAALAEALPGASLEDIQQAVEDYLEANPTGGTEYSQLSPLATWTVPVPATLGRRPNVTVYIDGEVVDTDISATSTQVVVTFPSPQTGTVVLS